MIGALAHRDGSTGLILSDEPGAEVDHVAGAQVLTLAKGRRVRRDHGQTSNVKRQNPMSAPVLAQADDLASAPCGDRFVAPEDPDDRCPVVVALVDFPVW
jgi:hypothetical protein